jgi:predicted RNA-binding protein with TRAM domain
MQRTISCFVDIGNLY